MCATEISCQQLGTPLSSMDASEEPNDAHLSGGSRLSLITLLTTHTYTDLIFYIVTTRKYV